MLINNHLALLILIIGNICYPFLRRFLYGIDTGEIQKIKTAKSLEDKDVGTYFIPGILGVTEDAFVPYAKGLPGDAWFVKFSTKDYDPNEIAIMIAEDIAEKNYSYVNLVTVSMGDQITSCLNFHLPNHILKDGSFRVYTIDPCIDRCFINTKYLSLLSALVPIAKIIQFLLGGLGEIPFIKHDSWNSPAELIKQLSEITYGTYGTKSLNVHNCYKCIIVNGGTFYAPADNAKIMKEYFGKEPVYELKSGRLGDVIGYKNIFIAIFEHAGLYKQPERNYCWDWD